MVFLKALTVLAFLAVASSTPLWGPNEHYLFGIPLPHTNNPIAHNVEGAIISGLEGITGIHSRANNKPMPGMDMGSGSGMSGMDMGGGSGMSGMNMGGGSGSGGFLGGLMGGLGGAGGGGSASSAPVSPNSDIDQKQLLQYLQLLQAQKQKTPNPTSDDVLKYLEENTNPGNSVAVKNGSGEDAELQQKLAALLAAQGNQ